MVDHKEGVLVKRGYSGRYSWGRRGIATIQMGLNKVGEGGGVD